MVTNVVVLKWIFSAVMGKRQRREVKMADFNWPSRNLMQQNKYLSSLVFKEDSRVFCVPSEPSMLFCEVVLDISCQSLMLEQLCQLDVLVSVLSPVLQAYKIFTCMQWLFHFLAGCSSLFSYMNNFPSATMLTWKWASRNEEGIRNCFNSVSMWWVTTNLANRLCCMLLPCGESCSACWVVLSDKNS